MRFTHIYGVAMNGRSAPYLKEETTSLDDG